jgi:hypothetical protein
MALDPRIKAGAAGALIATLGALAYGALPEERIHRASDGLSVAIDWEGEPPVGAGCVWTGTALVDQQTLGWLGRDAGGSECVSSMVCAGPADTEPELPGNIVALTDTQHTDPYTPGSPQIFVAYAGHPSLPCACSRGYDCEALVRYRDENDNLVEAWQVAPVGQVFETGRWRGTDGGVGGCFPRVCSEPSAGACWPPECPQ